MKLKRKPMSEETKKKISDSKKGTVSWNKGLKMSDEYREKCRQRQNGKSWSPDTQFTSDILAERWKEPVYKQKVSKNISRAMTGKKFSEEHKAALRGPRPHMRGENSASWKGGFVSDRPQAGLIQYRLWRLDVFERDDFTCALCDERGGKLNAHHIRKWKDHPGLRYDVNNGITLCISCHNKTKQHEEEYEQGFIDKLGEAT